MAQEIILMEKEFDGFVYNQTYDAFRYGGEAHYEALYTLTAGQDYTVVWDDTSWPCTAFAFTFDNGAECVGLGNINGDIDKEPFCIVYDITNNQIHYLSIEEKTLHTIAIYHNIQENIVIRNPKGTKVTYGEYDNILLTSSTGEKINYSKLPEVAETDNGYVLGVVNGLWNKMEGKFASSWNDLTEKPFGEEITEIKEELILSEQPTDEFYFGSDVGMFIIGKTGWFSLQEGMTYRVVWDDTEHTCVAFRMNYSGYEAIILGNDGYFKGETTEIVEPFVIYQIIGSNYCVLASTKDTTAMTHFVSITKIITKTYETQLDNKYLSILDGCSTLIQEQYLPILHDTAVPTEIETDILPLEEHGPFGFHSTFQIYGVQVTYETPYTLNVGQDYMVSWDGISYKCRAQDASVLLGAGGVAIGNVEKFNSFVGTEMFTGNGEPFVIGVMATGVAVYGALADTTEGGYHEIRIYQTQITEKSRLLFDNKYLDFMQVAPKFIFPITSLTFTSTFNDGNYNYDGSTGELFDALSTLKDGKSYEILYNGNTYSYIANDLTNMSQDAFQGVTVIKCLELGDATSPVQFSFLSAINNDTNEPVKIAQIHAKYNSTEPTKDFSIAIYNNDNYMIKEECLPIEGLPEVTTADNEKVLKVNNYGVWTVSTETQELPVVTTEDNDKVLSVVDGVWVAQTPASGLPDITSADENKFLRIINGVPTWVALTDVSQEGA